MATSGDQFDPTSLARELNTSLSLADASPVKPDDEAKLREVSKRLGIPLDSARTDPQAAMQAGKQDAFDPVKFAERFPSTAKHLANVDNALISNDDRDPLASVEDAVRQVGTSTANLGRSVGAAPFDVSSALYGVLESTFALGSQMVGRPLAENRVLPEDVFARGRQFFEQQRKAGAKIADNIAPANGSMGFVETAVNQGIRSFAQQAPGLAASVLTGNPAFALGMAGVQSGSTSTTKALDKGLTPVQALAYGATDAVIEIGTEKIPVSAFINDMKVGSGFFKTLIKNQMTEQPSEQVATALQDFNEWATLRPDATIADYISERPEAAAQTAIATLAGGVAQTSVFKGVQAVAERANGRQQQAETATAVAQQLDEVMAAAATSQTRVRDPQTFAQMVQDAAESSGTAPTELFIDAQPLLAIIEKAGMTPEQLTQMLPSVAEQIEEAIATDGTLTIPVGEATAAFAGSGFEQELVRNARTSVDAISVADAEQAGATVEALNAEAQQIIAEQQDKDAWELSAKTVFDTVTTQLNAAGRFTPEVNRAYATVARDYYAVQAAKMGMTPEQLYAQFPITVDARLPGGSDVLRRAGVLDQFAGQGASTADLNALTRAQQMSSKGVSNDTVLRDTGWFKGVDGRWRFEISDDKAAFKESSLDMEAAYADAEANVTYERDGNLFKAKYKPDTPDYVATFGRTEEDAFDNLAKQLAKRAGGTPFNISNVKDGDSMALSDVMDHPDLFAAYPFLRFMTVQFDRGGDASERGAFYEQRNLITVNADRAPREVLSTLLHEVQHAIQSREDFARGGNMDSNFTASVKTALQQISEREARLVEQWKQDNAGLLDTAEQAAKLSRNALKFESAERLLSYSERDKPSGVFRLIRNEMQWIYDEDFRKNEAARDLQYRFYDMPKRGDKRNSHIRQMAFDAAQVIRDSLPAEQLVLFKADPRTIKGMLNALSREASKARGKLQPLRDQQARAAAAEAVATETKFKSSYDTYRALAGEIEARTTQARQDLTPEQRRERSPRLDMDVSPTEAIVIVGGREMLIPSSMQDQGEKLNQPAYHGSPYRFDKFSLDHLGTGEGAQAFGWGLYFASQRDIAQHYTPRNEKAEADMLKEYQKAERAGDYEVLELWEAALTHMPAADIRSGEQFDYIPAAKREKVAKAVEAVFKRNPGSQLYKVEIPDDDQFLLWDKPFDEQPEKVKGALRASDWSKAINGTFLLNAASGSDIYQHFIAEAGFREPSGQADKGASLALRDLGIAGIKYKGSEGQGSFNYVVFDDQAVQIAETFYQSTQSTTLPDTLDIDGVQRPTTNNTGKPLAQTEEGVRNFWNWFGDSKVVDAQGRPLVVYHGTNADFDVFNTKGRGKSFDSGAFFTANPAIADTYTAGQNGNVMPVYLRISAMAEIDADGQNWKRLGKKTKVSLPKAVVSDQEDAELEAELTGVPAPANATKTLKARSTSLGRLFPDEFLFDDYFSTDDLSRWIGKTGYDGAVFTKILDRGANGRFTGPDTQVPSTVYTVFNPEQIKSATGNSGEFDPTNPSIVAQQETAPRATFDPASLNIALLEKADLSSYLHELGHAFFEISAHLAARPDAPQAIRDDIQTLFNTTGYTGTVQEWLTTPVSQRRIAHETIAESFEQYLLEGKAPTLEQQALFAKMRSWMVSVYRTLADFLSRNGNANLTAEVRGVFDRMLANDEAIAVAKAARGATPLFSSAEQAGMTPERFAEYQAATGEIDEDAVRELDSRSLRDLKWLRTARSRKIKELQADATAKRRNARIEARRQLLNEPVYRALTFLRGKVEPVPVEKRSGKKLDTRRDDLETAIAKLGGLNRAQVMVEFGVDRVSFPTKIVGLPTLRAGSAGKTIDAMGEALAEIGYLRYDENGKYDLNELGEKLLDQDRGISHYSMEADWDLINGYKMLPAPEDADALAISAGRLSLPELEERLGNTDIDFGKLGIGRRGMIQQNGMPMDVIAELTGFKSGEEMVRALVDAEPLQAATEGLTDRIMLERYGDLSSPEAIEQAADAALASEARTRMVATELSRLNTSVGSARVVATVARQTAQQVVARQKIRNVRPDKSAGAQARAGKGAEAAFRKGDIDTAAGFKRSQVLNAAIEREQRQTRIEIDKARDNFSAMFGNDKRAGKTRDMNLVNAARAMVARYGLAPQVAGQRAEDYQALLREYNPAMADNIQALFDTLPEPKDYRELTVEEFRGMRDAVLGIYQMSRRVMQTRIDGKLVEQDEVATVLVEAVLKRNGGELPGLLGYDSTITDAQKLKVNLLGLKAFGTRVEQWSDAMGAEVKRVIYQQVSDAAVQARLKRTELISAYKQLLDGVKDDITYDKIVAPELGGFEFTRGKTELLHAILHTGNESNKRKLLLGRRWAELDAEGNIDSTRWDSFVSRMVQQGVLTQADFDFAQGVWDLLETVKADAQKAHFDIFGYYFNEVTANTFTDPFGVERRGGYVPALVTTLSAADQAQKREAEAAQQGGNSYMFPTTGKGFTNSRVEYNRPLELDLRTIGSHLDKVARFAFLEPAISDTARLLQNKRVARAMNGLDTNIISKMLTPWLQRAAQQTTTVPTRFPQADKFFRGLRTRSGMYIMFANVINTMQQLTGFSVAAVKVPAPKMLRALKAYTGNPGEMARMTAELSAFMRDRLDNQGFEMTQQIDEILTNPTVLDKAGDFMKRNAYFLQTGLQNVMDVVVWQAAYDHARGMTGVSDKQAIRYADETIRTTQGTFAPEAVSGIEVQPAFIQLFTQFWGYFNMLANTLGGEAGKAVREMGYMASTPRLLMIWFAGLAIPAVVGQMIAQGIPDDDDDEDGDGTLDEWLAMFFGSQASTLAAMVPGVGQLSMLVANQFDNKIYNDRLNLSPAISMIDSAAGGAKAVLQGTAFDDRLTKKEVRDVAIAVALATGAPTNVIAKPLGYVLDVEAGKKEPDNAAEYGIGLLTGR